MFNCHGDCSITTSWAGSSACVNIVPAGENICTLNNVRCINIVEVDIDDQCVFLLSVLTLDPCVVR